MSDNKQSTLKSLGLSILWLILSLWIARNIYIVHEWEISSFFKNLIESICNFFKVILLGTLTYNTQLTFSWWLIPFCVACYSALYSGIRALCLWGNLSDYKKPNKPLPDESRDQEDDDNVVDVRTQILKKYISYEDFSNHFDGFDQLSKKAKEKVKSWFD